MCSSFAADFRGSHKTTNHLAFIVALKLGGFYDVSCVYASLRKIKNNFLSISEHLKID